MDIEFELIDALKDRGYEIDRIGFPKSHEFSAVMTKNSGLMISNNTDSRKISIIVRKMRWRANVGGQFGVILFNDDGAFFDILKRHDEFDGVENKHFNSKNYCKPHEAKAKCEKINQILKDEA